MKAAVAASAKARAARRAAGIAGARAWHVRMKPHFDAAFGFARCDCAAHRGPDR